MTRRDTLQCVHEPFGDAFYFGPERLSERYEKDEKGRIESGFSESTFKTIFDRIKRENAEVGLFCLPLSIASVACCLAVFFASFGPYVQSCRILLPYHFLFSFLCLHSSRAIP